SRECRLLLDWIAAGAPGPRKDEPDVKRVYAEPAQRVLRPGQQQQLVVFTEYADGRKRDVTWLARFDSNDAGVAAVDARGLIQVKRPGETAIRASFMGQVAVVIVTAPFDQKIAADAFRLRNNFIDDHVLTKLAALNIEPSGLSDDAEFCRRVFLDSI